MTPFEQGRHAAEQGIAQDANPFPQQIATGDEYPGPWANWRAGWINQTATTRHDERTNK